MKIDLCKIFGVEEGEEFKFDGYETIYFIQNGYLYFINSTKKKSILSINDVVGKNIIKLPKKKEFTDDELCILRNADKELKWIARDYYNNSLKIFTEKPQKNICKNWVADGAYRTFNVYNHLFKSITSEDEEPVYIDDYADR